MALASGIAVNGGKPVYGVYSTFVSGRLTSFRKICASTIARLPSSFYAASIYGMNDVTHLGIYDIPMMANIPNLVYLAPTTKEEYLAMLDWSLAQRAHPVAIRVPAGLWCRAGKPLQKISAS